MKAPRANRYRDHWAGDLRGDQVGERVLMAAEEEEPVAGQRVFISHAADNTRADAFDIARALREQGIRVEMEQAGRSLKGQFKQADRIGADVVVILGDKVEVKDMGSGEQRPVRDTGEAVERVRELLA